jgi:hypothetical protein
LFYLLLLVRPSPAFVVCLVYLSIEVSLRKEIKKKNNSQFVSSFLAPFFPPRVQICRSNFVVSQKFKDRRTTSMCGIGLIVERAAGGDRAVNDERQAAPVDFGIMRAELAKRGPDRSNELVIRVNDFDITFIGSGAAVSPAPSPLSIIWASLAASVVQCWRCVANRSCNSHCKTMTATCWCGMAKCLVASR